MAFEKVVAGGSVIDGTGAAAYRADVAIEEGRIAAVGDLAAAERSETIDASGQVVCPGFIDMHAHSDVSMLDDPGGESKAYQGVTTEVVGNCGSSAFPAGLLTPVELQEIAPVQVVEGSAVRYAWRDFDGWAEALEGSGVSLNVVAQIGHSTLRQAAKATKARPANDQELALMKRLVAEAVEQGAVALTTQLTGPRRRRRRTARSRRSRRKPIGSPVPSTRRTPGSTQAITSTPWTRRSRSVSSPAFPCSTPTSR